MDYNSYYYTTTTPTDSAAAAGIGIIAILIGLFFAAVAYVISALLLSQIFHKAGLPRWIAWVPFYNNWKFLELGGQPGFWAVLTIIPVVNIASYVFIYIAMYHVGLKLGKSGAFVILGILLPIVWFIWLAVDSSKWGDTYQPPAPVAPTPPTV
jgi:hypothetical protein